METFLPLFFLSSPVLWVFSLIILKDWKHFWKFFFANLFILACYYYILLFTRLIDLGHDEYGLVAIGAFLFTISIHVLLGFLFAMTYKYRKASSQTFNPEDS
jgi:hypothetical protein